MLQYSPSQSPLHQPKIGNISTIPQWDIFPSFYEGKSNSRVSISQTWSFSWTEVSEETPNSIYSKTHKLLDDFPGKDIGKKSMYAQTKICDDTDTGGRAPRATTNHIIHWHKTRIMEEGIGEPMGCLWGSNLVSHETTIWRNNTLEKNLARPLHSLRRSSAVSQATYCVPVGETFGISCGFPVISSDA